MDEDAATYRVVRHFFRSGRKRIIRRALPLSLAQEHCRDPETSSSTATKAEHQRRTRRYGPWFDGYYRNGRVEE